MLCLRLNSYNWEPLLQEHNIQASYDDFVKVLKWHIDTCIPKKNVVISRNASRFVSPLIQLLLLKRNRLMHTCKYDLAAR